MFVSLAAGNVSSAPCRVTKCIMSPLTLYPSNQTCWGAPASVTLHVISSVEFSDIKSRKLLTCIFRSWTLSSIVRFGGGFSLSAPYFTLHLLYAVGEPHISALPTLALLKCCISHCARNRDSSIIRRSKCCWHWNNRGLQVFVHHYVINIERRGLEDLWRHSHRYKELFSSCCNLCVGDQYKLIFMHIRQRVGTCRELHNSVRFRDANKSPEFCTVMFKQHSCNTVWTSTIVFCM